MVDGVTIRLASPEDAEIIAHHRRAMFADMGAADPAGLVAMDATFVPFVRRALAEGTYKGWLACTNGQRVVAGGGLIVHEWPAGPNNPDPHWAYILNVYTEPTYRRRGIARGILLAIIEWCRVQGFGRVALHASQAGRPLYESLGFEPTNEMRLQINNSGSRDS